MFYNEIRRDHFEWKRHIRAWWLHITCVYALCRDFTMSYLENGASYTYTINYWNEAINGLSINLKGCGQNALAMGVRRWTTASRRNISRATELDCVSAWSVDRAQDAESIYTATVKL